jgi:hypothetical protein
MKEVAIINGKVEEGNEIENDKLDNITKITTLSLIQVSDNKCDMKEMKINIDELKLTVKEINNRVIEYGIHQDELKNKEIGGRGSGLPNPVSGRRGFNGSDCLRFCSPRVPGNVCQVECSRPKSCWVPLAPYVAVASVRPSNCRNAIKSHFPSTDV